LREVVPRRAAFYVPATPRGKATPCTRLESPLGLAAAGSGWHVPAFPEVGRDIGVPGRADGKE